MTVWIWLGTYRWHFASGESYMWKWSVFFAVTQLVVRLNGCVTSTGREKEAMDPTVEDAIELELLIDILKRDINTNDRRRLFCRWSFLTFSLISVLVGRLTAAMIDEWLYRIDEVKTRCAQMGYQMQSSSWPRESVFLEGGVSRCKENKWGSVVVVFVVKEKGNELVNYVLRSWGQDDALCSHVFFLLREVGRGGRSEFNEDFFLLWGDSAPSAQLECQVQGNHIQVFYFHLWLVGYPYNLVLSRSFFYCRIAANCSNFSEQINKSQTGVSYNDITET